MKLNIEIIQDEYDHTLSRRVSLLMFCYLNLCTKTEPAALLSVPVTMGGKSYGLEEVAEVAFDGEKLLNPDEVEDEDPILLILSTIPEVNKERHDALLKAVDIFYDKCKVEMEKYKANYTAQLVQALENNTSENPDEAKDKLEQTNDTYTKMRDELKEKKIKEVEDAYQRYLAKETEKENRPPRASDLRESGSIEQDADYIMILSRVMETTRINSSGNEEKTITYNIPDKAYMRNPTVKVNIVKNRHGSVDEDDLIFNKELTKFEIYN